MFTCVESAARGHLTVPAYVLSNMMATNGVSGNLFLLRHPLTTRFSAPRLDLGYIMDFGAENADVEFR